MTPKLCVVGALKGTNLSGQTENKRRLSLIFADSQLFLENWAPKSAEWICGGFFELNFSQTFPKQNLPTPTRVHLVAQNFWTFVLVWLSWLCSASQPFAGSSMVVVCWLDLGVSCIQAGMDGLIRSNGLWQAACISRSTYGLKSRRKPRQWSGRRWTCSAWAETGHLNSTCVHRKGPSCW